MSMLEAQRTTLADYEVLVEAYNKRSIDKKFIASYTAWQTALAQSTDKKGKPIYRRFKDLFDYEKELKELEIEEVDQETKDLFIKLTEINKD